MNAKLKLAIFIMLTAICGVGVVTWETPQNLLLFVLWSAVAIVHVRRLHALVSGKAAFAAAATHASVMAVIVTVAILAPVKRVDAVLQKPLQLQSDKMTVAELSEYCQFNRETLPLTIYIPSGGTALNRQLNFSSTRMPLQQFIVEVEQQTGCTHHFGGCGNAYSILYGSADNFGLSFVPPSDSGYKWQ